jgi:hypothetical protein
VILGFPALQRVGLRSGLLAFYKLSDTSDSSGRGNTLTNNGGVTFVAGKIGNAAEFDGANWFDFNLSLNARTVSAWIKTESTESFNVIAEFSNVQLQFIDNGQLRVNGTGGDEAVGANANDGNWNHCVFVFSDNENLVYLNGTKYTLSTTFQEMEAGVVTIGATPNGEFDKWEGLMDAVGIWSRALSEAEVSALYNNGTGRELP